MKKPEFIREPFPEAARIRIVHVLINGESRLKRDNELVRQLMLEVEADADPVVYFDPISEDGDDCIEYYHLRLLADEGLLEESGAGGGNFRITNKGHDFIAAVRSDDIWRMTTRAASTVAGASISMLKDIALGYVKQELAKRGIPFG